jgi:hypothetical protein
MRINHSGRHKRSSRQYLPFGRVYSDDRSIPQQRRGRRASRPFQMGIAGLIGMKSLGRTQEKSADVYYPATALINTSIDCPATVKTFGSSQSRTGVDSNNDFLIRHANHVRHRMETTLRLSRLSNLHSRSTRVSCGGVLPGCMAWPEILSPRD